MGPRLWPRYARLLNHPGTLLGSQPKCETIDIDGALRAVQAARALPRIPLAVISKTEPFATAPGAPKDVLARVEQVWPIDQDLQVKLEPQTPHVLAAGSDHYGQIHDPDLTTSIIRLILDRVRHNGGGHARDIANPERLAGRDRFVVVLEGNPKTSPDLAQALAPIARPRAERMVPASVSGMRDLSRAA